MESRNLKLDAVLGLIVVGIIALFVWLSFSIGGNAPKGAKRYTLLFDSALGLHEDNDVAVAGVLIGTIDSIGIDGRLAKVVVALSPDVTLHENARAAVRAKSLLGEKYIDLDPGSNESKTLEAGATLRNNVPTVEIDEVIRSVQELVATLNVIAPPLEKAVVDLQGFLSETDGQDLTQELVTTVRDAGALIRETNALVSTSGKDLSTVLELVRARGPRILESVDRAGGKLDAILNGVSPESVKKISEGLVPVVGDVGSVAQTMRVAMADVKDASAKLETMLSRVDKNLARLDQINERAIREFLQVEGVRVNLIPDVNVQRRVRRLRNEPDPLSVLP